MGELNESESELEEDRESESKVKKSIMERINNEKVKRVTA